MGGCEVYCFHWASTKWTFCNYHLVLIFFGLKPISVGSLRSLFVCLFFVFSCTFFIFINES